MVHRMVRETKPVEKGKSKYTISEEEKEAIQKAIDNQNVYRVKEK